MARKLTKKNTKVIKVVKKPKMDKPVMRTNHSDESTVMSLPKSAFFEGVGRRKTAVARVRIYKEKGDFIVNNLAVGQYFANVINAYSIYLRPLEVSGLKGEFTISVKVKGSGKAAQLGAVSHGLSRALIKFDPALKPLLKKEGLMTRDDRMKETRKIGMGGKARRKRQSPKR